MITCNVRNVSTVKATSCADGSLEENHQTASLGGDLEVLMVRYQQADPGAPAELVGKLSPRLLGFFSKSKLTRPDAEHLLQEFWIRIHKARHTYRPGAPVLPWVYAIARYTLIDGHRRLNRTRWFQEIDSGHVPETRSPVTNVDLAVDMRRLIAKLPASQQQALLMLKVTGMSLAEVARATGSTVGAVKQRAHRAYVKLRSILDDQGYFKDVKKPRCPVTPPVSTTSVWSH